MNDSVIEKKFKKIGSKELRVKLSRGLLSATEVEIVKGILNKRETGESYKSPDFEKESQETVKKIAEKQKNEPSSISTKEVKPKVEEKKTLKIVLTSEDSVRVKKVIDGFKGSKKELVVHLLESGFTKQQLDKYQPQIAHWSYIYDIARSMGK